MSLPDNCTRTQGFGHNYNPAYAQVGLRGHPAYDESCGFGSIVSSPVSGQVIGTYTPERPASDGYTAVFILVETPYELMEFAVGHLSEVFVQVGQYVARGDAIGREGNRGTVYSGGRRVTLAEQAAGSTAGSHRHYQCRVVVEVNKRSARGNYLRNWNGYVRGPDGGYLEWAMPDNGYNSCVDFLGPVFARDLAFSSKGYEVLLLQKLIGMSEGYQTGVFAGTTADAVKVYQRLNGIDGTGYVGPATRAALNKQYERMDSVIESVEGQIARSRGLIAQVPTLPLEDQKGAYAWIVGLLTRVVEQIVGAVDNRSQRISN